MWNTNQLYHALLASLLFGVVGLAYADPVPSDRGSLEDRADEAFEDLDRVLDPEAASETIEQAKTGEERIPPTSAGDEAPPVIESETVVNTTELNGRPVASHSPASSEPSQRELYERLLQEEASGRGHATGQDDVWVESPTIAPTVTPQAPPTTVIVYDDDEDYRRYRRSGLWYFFHHLLTGSPHHIHRDRHRTHPGAKQAKRRSRTERRARKAAAERRLQKKRAAKRKAQRRAKKAAAERRAKRARAERRAIKRQRRAAKRQGRTHRTRANNGRRSRRSR